MRCVSRSAGDEADRNDLSQYGAVSYGYFRDGWSTARELPKRLALDSASVCEIGAGANPLLAPRDGYLLVDIDRGELAKAGPGYATFEADICSPDFQPPGEFDLAFSLSTAEHVPDARQFHMNTRRLLRTGGVAVHFFPTLYAVPFVANRLLNDRLSEKILLTLDPKRTPDGNHAKFPAFYRWCRGPTRRQIARLESCGFAVEEYHGYFGHNYYRPLGLQPVMDKMSHWMIRHPSATLTSFALVVLRAT
jgi:SAM-dependent methyltransferase